MSCLVSSGLGSSGASRGLSDITAGVEVEVSCLMAGSEVSVASVGEGSVYESQKSICWYNNQL